MTTATKMAVRVVPAARDTRCRSCWRRIAAGDLTAYVDNLPFHRDCRFEVTPFPAIDRLDARDRLEAGQDEDEADIPDHPYRTRNDRGLWSRRRAAR